MARKKQTFDPHALTREVVSATHEVVTVPFRLRTYRVIRKILIIFIAVSIVNVVFANVFYTPKTASERTTLRPVSFPCVFNTANSILFLNC